MTAVFTDIPHRQTAWPGNIIPYQATYVFGDVTALGELSVGEEIRVGAHDFFDKNKGYGFLGGDIISDERGIHIEDGVRDGGFIPLTFRAKVPCSGNFKVTLVLEAADEPVTDITIFSGNRRLESLKGDYCAHEIRAYVFDVNTEDETIDVTVIGSSPMFNSLTIEETLTPTVYIVGDSTVMDHSCNYPYRPDLSMCGWGQFFPYFVSNLAAVTNHGFPCLSISEYAYGTNFKDICNKVKHGDFCMLHFGSGVLAQPVSPSEYMDSLLYMVSSLKKAYATPVIVTPLAANTWSKDGEYSDLLTDYANVCIRAALSERVALIDLHTASRAFIEKSGYDKASCYFYPDDNIHLNDYGAYLMAGLAAKEIKKHRDDCPIPIRTSLCGKIYDPVMNAKRPMTMEELMASDNFVPPNLQ